jgi:hypothetical protein
VVGPAGLGKTQLCLTMCVVGCMDCAAAAGRVLFLDTERKFSAERLAQIARARFPGEFSTPAAVATLLDRVLVQEPASSADLLKLLEVSSTGGAAASSHPCLAAKAGPRPTLPVLVGLCGLPLFATFDAFPLPRPAPPAFPPGRASKPPSSTTASS